jgi:muramidase (phage lysozyme)
VAIPAVVNPLDATGKAAEKAAKAKAKELADRADEISLVNQAEAESLQNDVFDPKHQDVVILDEIEELGVSTTNDMVVIRTVADIDEMTFGVGNTYTFKQGRKYKVPAALADYLEQLGYIWRPN